VRDCRRCGDDDLRRHHHGPRQADGRCLDVVASVRTAKDISLAAVGTEIRQLAAQLCEEWKRRQKRKARQEDPPRLEGGAP
jgi:hypothetical protein